MTRSLARMLKTYISGTKFPLCEELGIGLVAWGPLGQGFLTGGITRGMKFDDPNDLRKDFPASHPKRWKPTSRWSTS